MSLMMLGMMTLSCFAQAKTETTPNSKNFVNRFDTFVKKVATCDTLSKAQKAELSNTYDLYLAEYKVVKDSLSDDEVRQYSKSKAVYQKSMARIFVRKTSNDVADTAEEVGKNVSKFFKKTKKKVQGAVEGFKEN